MKNNRPKRKQNSLFKTLYICCIILLVVLFLKQEWNIYKVRAASDAVQSTISSLEKTQNDFKKEISNLHELSYIERVARGEYKMIKPNEIPIIIRE